MEDDKPMKQPRKLLMDNRDLLGKLDDIREAQKLAGILGRQTHDCFTLKARGDRAVCEKGHLLGTANDGALALISVLRGIKAGACQNCEDWND
jgi:hypothetical protein